MANGINIGLQRPIMDVLDRLDQGLVSFEQAIWSIRNGGVQIVDADAGDKIIPAALRMGLFDQTPYQ